MKIDGFMTAMAAAIALALLWPEVGTADGPLRLGLLTQIGIGIVFFLHGAALSPQALKSGAANWRLHLIIQSTTYVVFPILGGLLWFATRDLLPDGLRLGFFYLCAVSSTIASSVAMTALARGNVASAVFNATLSGLIGMVATPILMGLVSNAGSGDISLGEAILDIFALLLLPFLVGQLVRPLIGAIIARHRPRISLLDKGVIILIVYSSFADSTAAGLWTQFSPAIFLLVAGIATLLLLLALFYTTVISRAAGLSRSDEAAAVFCGSKKSLANGAPIANILFGGSADVGLIVLPLLLYHQIQLIVCAALARRYADRAQGNEDDPEHPADISVHKQPKASHRAGR